MTQYGTLAHVYEWLVTEELLTPEGNAAALDGHYELAPGARVLDCAAGTGTLAVGLALRGFEVVATDASEAMIERTRALAAERGVELSTRVCTWEALAEQRWEQSFDAVFCVGNSLTHAEGQAARRRALAAMAALLRAGGLLVVTSRNWELERSRGSRVTVSERLVERAGGRGLVVQGWTIADDWEELHVMEVVVALIADDGAVTRYGERLRCWPFRHETLDEDLRAAGVEPASTTYDPDVGRYLVTARR
jgi:SAM-dependent methyltransferase